MAFAPGDDVHVVNLGKGIVREVRTRGRYVVELKGRSLVVSEAQMELVRPRPRRAETLAVSEPAAQDGRLPAPRHAASILDLHGLTSAEALVALDAFLSDALLAAHGEVHVIHGRSGGTLRAAVHKRLREIPSVRAFRVDPHNPGVTIVQL